MPSYFISFRTYGSWLHGDERGAVDLDHNVPGTPRLKPNPRRADYEHSLLKIPGVELDDQRRWVVRHTIESVCEHRKWELHAVHVRTTHVHAVLTSDETPEKVMTDLKAWCTRRMCEAGVFERERRAWARHGSTRWLNTQHSFERAVHYVRFEQGPDLPERQPQGTPVS